MDESVMQFQVGLMVLIAVLGAVQRLVLRRFVVGQLPPRQYPLRRGAGRRPEHADLQERHSHRQGGLRPPRQRWPGREQSPRTSTPIRRSITTKTAASTPR